MSRSRYIKSVNGRNALVVPGKAKNNNSLKFLETIMVDNPSVEVIDELLRQGDVARDNYKQRQVREERCRIHEIAIRDGSMTVIDQCVVAIHKGRKMLINGRTRLTAVKRVGHFKGRLVIQVYTSENEKDIGLLCSVFDDRTFARTMHEKMDFMCGKEIKEKWSHAHFGRVHHAVHNLLSGVPPGKGMADSRPMFSGATKLNDSKKMAQTGLEFGDIVTWFKNNFRIPKPCRLLNRGIVTAIIHSKYVFGDDVVSLWNKCLTGLEITEDEISLKKLGDYVLSPSGQHVCPGSAAGQAFYYNMATWAFLAAKDVYGLRGTPFKTGLNYWMNSTPEVDKTGKMKPAPRANRITMAEAVVRVLSGGSSASVDEVVKELPAAGYAVIDEKTTRRSALSLLSKLARAGVLKWERKGTYRLVEKKAA